MSRDMFTGEERAPDGAPPETITEAEFVERFTARLVANVGETDAEGESVREYGARMGPTYYRDRDQRADGPEACADADLDCWGPV